MATKKVRILVDTTIEGEQYKCGSVVELDPELAKQQVKAGAADDAPAAVGYALKSGKTLVKHVTPKGEADSDGDPEGDPESGPDAGGDGK